jgi:chromosome segregation ATPase
VELYRLREQEKTFVEMEQRLLEQTAKISDLDAQRKSLLAVEKNLEKELNCARTQIQELQEQIHMEAEQSAAELMKLKQKISVLEAKEDESVKRQSLLEKKSQSLRDLEIEVVELRRTNKELQHHKRELNIKLNEVTSQPTHSSNVNQVLCDSFCIL